MQVSESIANFAENVSNNGCICVGLKCVRWWCECAFIVDNLTKFHCVVD